MRSRAKILLSRTEGDLGVRSIDNLLYFFFKSRFPNFFTSEQLEGKIRIRFLEAISRYRKILSSNQEAHIQIDNLNNDQDFTYVLTRKEFESIIQKEFLDRVRAQLELVSSEIGQS